MFYRFFTTLIKLLVKSSLFISLSVFAQNSFIDSHAFSLELSELKHRSTDNELEARGEAELSNINQESFSYDILFNYHYDRKSSPYNSGEMIERSWQVEQSFEKKNVIGPISYTNYFSLEQLEEEGIYTEKYDLEIGVFGIKANKEPSDLISELSFEYIPLYHYLKFEEIDYDDESESYNGQEKFNTEKSLSHAFNFVANFNLWKSKLIANNLFSWKVVQALDQESSSESNHIFYLKNKIKYRVNSHFSVGYTFELETDHHRERYGYPKTQRTSRLTLNFNWN